MPPTSERSTLQSVYGCLTLLVIVAAMYLAVKLFAVVTTFAIVAIVLLALYEAYRLYAAARGLPLPPSSLGMLQRAGRALFRGAYYVPRAARWTARVARVAANSKREIGAGAALGATGGLLAGWHLGAMLLSTCLGAGAGVILGLWLGWRRLRPRANTDPGERGA